MLLGPLEAIIATITRAITTHTVATITGVTLVLRLFLLLPLVLLLHDNRSAVKLAFTDALEFSRRRAFVLLYTRAD